MKDFKQKVVVITGAASGIGLCLANSFAARGANLVITDLNQEALDKVKNELESVNTKVIAVPADVRKFEQVNAVANAAFSEFGQVDVLINNAGVFTAPKFTWECDENEWDFHLDINLKGVINGVRAFMPRILEQGNKAHIVNTASLAGHVVEPCFGPYHASKFGVVAISESIKLELEMLGNTDIKLSVACPGFVKTGLLGTLKGFEVVDGDPLAMITEHFTAGSDGRGLDGSEVALQIIKTIEDENFYLFTHDFSQEILNHRMSPIIKGNSAGLRDDQIESYGVDKIQQTMKSN